MKAMCLCCGMPEQQGRRATASRTALQVWTRGRQARLWRALQLCWRDAACRRLLLDNLLTTCGAGFTLLALPQLLLRLSGQALSLGLASAAEALPALLLLLLGTRWLQRWPALHTLRICRALFVLLNLALAALVALAQINSWVVYGCGFIGGLVWALAFPAGRIVLAQSVRRPLLPLVNAVFALVAGFAALCLPLLAGSLILQGQDIRPLAFAFALDGLCVLLSLPLLASLAALPRLQLTRGQLTHPAGRPQATPASAQTSAAAPLPEQTPVQAIQALSTRTKKNVNFLANGRGCDARRAVRRSAPLSGSQKPQNILDGYLDAASRFNLACAFVAGVLVFGPLQSLLPWLLAQQAAQSQHWLLLLYPLQFLGLLAGSLRLPAPQRHGTLRALPRYWLLAAVGWLLLALANVWPQSPLPALGLILACVLLAASSNRHALCSLAWLQQAHVQQPPRLARAMTCLSALQLLAAPCAALLCGALLDTLGLASSAALLALASSGAASLFLCSQSGNPDNK